MNYECYFLEKATDPGIVWIISPAAMYLRPGWLVRSGEGQAYWVLDIDEFGTARCIAADTDDSFITDEALAEWLNG